MSFKDEVYQWDKELAKHFRGLSKPQRGNIARYGVAVLKARDCRMSIMAEEVPELGSLDSAERRLQRTVGNKRVDAGRCQRDWARWLLSLLEGPLYILIDETKLGGNLSVMLAGLAYRGRCIPLLWRCYKPHAYPAEGQVGMIKDLLTTIQEVLPAGASVPLVQVDRGIGTSPALVRVVEALHWHYLFRVQNSTQVRLPERGQVTIGSLVKSGQRFTAAGQVFKGDGFVIQTIIHVLWGQSYCEPWCLISNDPDATAEDYAVRAWQEASFHDLKSGGWQWNNSRVWKPAHADRLILILALAYSFCLSLGTLVLLAPPAVRRRLSRGSHSKFSIFRLGLRLIKHAARSALACPFHLLFVPLPASLHPPPVL